MTASEPRSGVGDAGGGLDTCRPSSLPDGPASGLSGPVEAPHIHGEPSNGSCPHSTDTLPVNRRTGALSGLTTIARWLGLHAYRIAVTVTGGTR